MPVPAIAENSPRLSISTVTLVWCTAGQTRDKQPKVYAALECQTPICNLFGGLEGGLQREAAHKWMRRLMRRQRCA